MSGSRNDWNAHTIAEFRRNHGKVGGPFQGAPLLLLRHTGARSGKLRVNPVMYLKDGDRYIVFATKAGADTNPDWYFNLKAHPDILDAYWAHGFYVFEGVLREELGLTDAEIARLREEHVIGTTPLPGRG